MKLGKEMQKDSHSNGFFSSESWEERQVLWELFQVQAKLLRSWTYAVFKVLKYLPSGLGGHVLSYPLTLESLEVLVPPKHNIRKEYSC